MSEIKIPFSVDEDLVKRFEEHMDKKGIKFKRKGRKSDSVYMYQIEDISAQDAYWLGCNTVSISHKLFDGPFTKSG